jgi:hypothetical protein
MTPNSMAPRLRNPGDGEHNIVVDENPVADGTAVVITWRVLPSVCTVACAVFFLLALVVSSPAERIAWGLVAVFFAAGAIYNFRRRYELSQVSSSSAGSSP